MGSSQFLSYTAVLAAILAASVSAEDVLVTTTVNQTHCVSSSNIGNFYHYGAAFATKGNKVFSIQYEAQNVTCCDFDLANDVNITIADISKSASATPCSDHVECQTNGDCDPNATCVMGSTGTFMCQCTDLYEGDGFSCSRKPHWSEWSEFGPYSVSCGSGATRTRTRTCSKPPRCEGSDTDSETVDLEACPVPTTTTLPPTLYQACGTRKCHACSGGPATCSNKGLDRDKDYDDLRGCPSGYQFNSYKKYPQWWPAADVYLRICSSIPPAPVARYRYQMCGAVNCIGCDQANCQNQSQKHLAAATQISDSAACLEDYTDITEDSGNQSFRVCRSNQKYYD